LPNRKRSSKFRCQAPILADEGSTENNFRIKIGLIFLLLFLSRKKVTRRLGFLFKLDVK
jgi:hypothetical protein